MPSCQDVTHLQSRALDESLTLRVRIGLKCHLLYCVWCRRYGRQLRFLRQAFTSDGERLAGGVVRKLSPEARQQIKEFLWKEVG